MKILICGGTGLLGYHAALAALADGHEVGFLAIDDIDLTGWYPDQIHRNFGDIFSMTEDELVPYFQGYDAMAYCVGPDDRVTPPAPSYDFFHKHLVEDSAKVFRAARRAGVKRAVAIGSYFATFDRMYPKKKLAVYHPYIRCRLEQAEKLLAEAGSDMDVMILECPYIFGTMPKRTPLWKDVFIERFFRYPAVFFPGGGTTMITAQHVGEAVLGALKYGDAGIRYPIGDENRTFHWMVEAFEEGLGIQKPIFHPSGRLCGKGAQLLVARPEAREGKQSGLDFYHLMTGVMSKEMYIPEQTITAMSEQLHFGRGGVREAILETMKACYPNGFSKKR
jgi:Nucleoside-diphosphate-sugar epimerases